MTDMEQMIMDYQDVPLEILLKKCALHNERKNEYINRDLSEDELCDYLIESEIVKKLNLIILCRTMIVKGYVLDNNENWKKIDIDSEDEDEELIKKYLGYTGFINIEN